MVEDALQLSPVGGKRSNIVSKEAGGDVHSECLDAMYVGATAEISREALDEHDEKEAREGVPLGDARLGGEWIPHAPVDANRRFGDGHEMLEQRHDVFGDADMSQDAREGPLCTLS